MTSLWEVSLARAGKDQPQRDERDDAQADCHGEAVLAHHGEEAEVEGQHGGLVKLMVRL